jgi:hypothetical protein
MELKKVPAIITINAPLILKMRDIIFFCGQTVLTPKLPLAALGTI